MATSFLSATRLVAEREIKSSIRLKGFWIGFAFLLVALFAAAILPTAFGGGREAVAAIADPQDREVIESDLDSLAELPAFT